MEKKENLFYIFTGLAISIATSVVLVLIFAILISVFSIPSSVIKPVNIAIKIIALTLGVFFAVKEEKGLLKGLVFGVLFSVFSNLIFLVPVGNFYLDLSLFIDIAFCSIFSAILGVIKLNLIRF